MPKPVLNSARVVASIRQGIAAGVPEHVAVNLEGQAGALTDALYKPIYGVRGEGASALCGEHEGAIRELPVKLSQSPQLVAADRMCGRRALLDPADVQDGVIEVDLTPLQVDQFGRT